MMPVPASFFPVEGKEGVENEEIAEKLAAFFGGVFCGAPVVAGKKRFPECGDPVYAGRNQDGGKAGENAGESPFAGRKRQGCAR